MDKKIFLPLLGLSALLALAKDNREKCLFVNLDDNTIASWVDVVLKKFAKLNLGYPSILAKCVLHNSCTVERAIIFSNFIKDFKRKPKYYLCILWGVESGFSNNLNLVNYTWDFCPLQVNVCTALRLKLKGYLKDYADLNTPFDLFKPENCVKLAIFILLYNAALGIYKNTDKFVALKKKKGEFSAYLAILAFYHRIKWDKEYMKYYNRVVKMANICKQRCCIK
jgi:hypothetical protein